MCVCVYVCMCVCVYVCMCVCVCVCFQSTPPCDFIFFLILVVRPKVIGDVIIAAAVFRSIAPAIIIGHVTMFCAPVPAQAIRAFADHFTGRTRKRFMCWCGDL